MSETAVCYVTDLPFLAPSLASALRLREFVSPDAADIYIFTLNVDAALLADINRTMASAGIRLTPLDVAELKTFDAERLAKTHTPLGTFGRFFMEEALPASIRHIVYLDGDVWAVRDPSELICTPVPDGFIAAADDPVTYRRRFRLGGTAQTIDGYFSALGVNPARGYFNAGVFAASRASWRDIARDAYAFYKNNIDACAHFDQSALNAVASERRKHLSCRWNFQTQYRIWNADSVVTPCIYHFTHNPKPWSCRLEPWPEMFVEYERVFAKIAAFQLPIRRLDDAQAAAANADRSHYTYLRLPPVSWLARTVMGFERSEADCWI